MPELNIAFEHAYVPRQVGCEQVSAQRPALAKFHAPEIVFGPDSLAELGYSARRLGARRPFLVTDPGIVEAGWVRESVAHLREAGLAPVVWHDLTPNPKDHEVQAAHHAYAEAGADVIIAVGGGSCIDAAKGVAILSANGGHILDYEGVDHVVNPIPPLVMVPSTSGTGADVSQFCVVTDTTNATKATIISRTLVPEISIIDPRLLTTMPDWLNAATGLDALTHAMESYVSLAHNVLTDHHSLHAVHLVTKNLLRTLLDPADEEPRTAMAQGSLAAGMAFTNAILGATHAMSHQVGGLLDAPHGVINGVLLPHVIRFNAEQDPARYVPLASAAGIDTDRLPSDEVAEVLADRVRDLADSVGVPRGLSCLGVGEHNVADLARTTMKDACLATNPRQVTQAEIESLFRSAM
ncbi:1,3-propanediol dehydrogenase [Saccharopolyspora erythraea NRRL 2338]|uniref:1,3-propanediol dehydrogenase n=2 Tax=Saccharopolyspora erythraea TaxID=1836 RepID=A4FCA4_SACEN|nr:iron-containing alcohol dehydrogenase [Saccharopolyspora erythraea]EQD84996.1 alcohol dehydrogenase [Saccharopolyspora erythraea D]PFG95440.1 1,3-propanediol dehydrogenase [Saccharopolyspora erythraea NRRL 2338]QRK92075.1 iron-containing alcohol dehydrogenase [Saccharopolyspora erythraea]CAM01679.1 1,3-propanediol dehydrogenase [Saccharopolyspora erythraea NRRL 2338]